MDNFGWRFGPWTALAVLLTANVLPAGAALTRPAESPSVHSSPLATVTGPTPSATSASTPSIASVPSRLAISTIGEIRPGIAVVKTSPTTAVTTVGQRVPYTFRVVNTGGWVLTKLSVVDVPAPPSSPANLAPVTCTAVTLAPGESTTCRTAYTVTRADLDNGRVTGIATAVGTPLGGSTPMVSAPSTLTISHQGSMPRLDVVTSSAVTAITTVGQRVPLSYLTVNTGGVTLTGVTVTDTLPPAQRVGRSAIRCGPGDAPSGAISLRPGESIECRSTYTVSAADLTRTSLLDLATAAGTPARPSATAAGTPAPGRRSAVRPPAGEVPGEYAALALTSSAMPTRVRRAGERITYAFQVTNTGRVTLTGVTLIDIPVPPADPAGRPAVTCGSDHTANGSVTLAAAASITCTGSYRVSAADARHGSVSNTATATGRPPAGSVAVSPEATVTVLVGELPVTGGPRAASRVGVLAASGLIALLSGVALLLVARHGRWVPGRSADRLR